MVNEALITSIIEDQWFDYHTCDLIINLHANYSQWRSIIELDERVFWSGFRE